MKKIGLKHPVYALYSDATGSPVYTAGAVIAKAISASIKINKNNVTLYADDDIDELDQSFISGTETLGINEFPHDVQSVLLGHAILNGEMTANESDKSPQVGHGFYGRIRRNGVDKWRAIWFKKVQFAEPDDETETKGETIAFKTPVIEGIIMKDINGNWKNEEVFDTEATAIAWLDGKAGITPICVTPIASVAAGTYAVAQSVTLTAGVGEAIHYTTNGTTPTATNGTLYSTAISVAATTMLRAVAIKGGNTDSKIANYEYIITA